MSTAAYASLSRFSVRTPGSDGNHVLLMPKLKYRFRVVFTGFGAQGDSDVLEMTRQIADAKRPSVQFATETIDVYNSKINYIGKPTWQDVTISVRDDVNNSTALLVAKQLQKQFDFFEQSAATSAGDYKFDMLIQMTDGGNGTEDAILLEEWACYGCIITTADYDSMNYKENTPVMIKLTIKMDNAVQRLAEGPGTGISDASDGVGSPSTQTRIPAASSSQNMVISTSQA